MLLLKHGGLEQVGFYSLSLSVQQAMLIVPTAIAYDLVLEDHVLARQRVKRSQRPFSRELAEMVRYAVGYRSRAIVTSAGHFSTSEADEGSGVPSSKGRRARRSSSRRRPGA